MRLFGDVSIMKGILANILSDKIRKGNGGIWADIGE